LSRFLFTFKPVSYLDREQCICFASTALAGLGEAQPQHRLAEGIVILHDAQTIEICGQREHVVHRTFVSCKNRNMEDLRRRLRSEGYREMTPKNRRTRTGTGRRKMSTNKKQNACTHPMPARCWHRRSSRHNPFLVELSLPSADECESTKQKEIIHD